MQLVKKLDDRVYQHSDEGPSKIHKHTEKTIKKNMSFLFEGINSIVKSVLSLELKMHKLYFHMSKI